MQIKDLGEEAFIDYLKEQFITEGPDRGIGDDAAVIQENNGMALLVTTDALVEGIHFIKEVISPRDLGYKTVAVSVSDIAAMGGEPKFALLTLALPKDTEKAWLEEFVEGLKEAGKKWKVSIVGGDTVGSKGGLFLSLTLFGRAPSKEVKLRSGALEGDTLFVTGNLGDSLLGLHALQKKWERTKEVDFLIKAHFRPEPEPAFGRWLAEKKEVHSLMDLSDGLDKDLKRMLKASSCGALIDIQEIPLSQELFRVAQEHQMDPYTIALEGGEDYCLLGAMEKDAFETLSPRFFSEFGHPLKKIGAISLKKRGICYVDGNEPFDVNLKPFNHFF